MSALTNAVASSSKRPAPSPATPSATPAKRPRAESHDEDEGDDDGEHDEPLQELDDSTRAKIARKEARTIRNRESAQRSRNQRKAHLANLEHRVAELERENRALRGESGSTPPPSRSAEREVSPANSVMSLANDLGLPHEMVSSSGGVNLATVAPPPADLDVDVDVKPIVTAAAALSPPRLPSTAPVSAGVTALQNENSALRERIGLLENLVKQVVALSNLGGLPTTAPAPVQPEAASPDSVQAFDWDTLVAPAQPSRLETTLSPSMYPTQPLDAVAQTAVVKSETSEMNLACHPAAVPGPAAGEEPFIFGNIGNDFGAYGNDGQSGYRHGETTGLGRDSVDFNLDASAFHVGQTSAPVGAFEAGVFEDGQEMGETWDEGMKTLLNNLEAVGGGAGEPAVRQENEWFGGWGYQKGNTTTLGLAV